MLRGNEDRKIVRRLWPALCSRPVLRARCRARETQGQALVEFAAIVPLLFLVIVLAMNFGGLIGAWVAVSNETRAAADYASLGGASAGLPTQATSTSLAALISNDLASLPNASSVSACVRTNNNGTYTTLLQTPSGACGNYTNPPSDGEAIGTGSTTNYVNLAVDVTYTYNSFFSGTTFLGLPLTVLPSTVHQRAVMRVQQ
jgi:Flp pilus assembly protein TadG